MDYQALEILISISLISVFVTGYYTPLNPIREWITDKWINFFVRRKMYKTAEIAIVFNCAKCMAFICYTNLYVELYLCDYSKYIRVIN